MLGRGTGTGTGRTRRPGGTLLRRRSPTAAAWDAEEVAAHLLDAQPRIVRGLWWQTPWVGLDDETRSSCYLHGAAVVARVAASGQRPEWLGVKDLEKAQVAAFRHQALMHWRHVKAQSREADRTAIAYDPALHEPRDEPVARLFEQPSLLTITADLLAELVDEELRAFWAGVFGDGLTFKEAGDRLGLDRARVAAHTRAGREAFDRYLDRRETGALCRERNADVLRMRAGTANAVQQRRAEAHLESCYACALVHLDGTSAFSRGILGVAPMGVLLRLATRAGEMASVPAQRLAETSAGSRAVAGGLAALSVAGSGVGVQMATKDAPEPRRTPAARTTVPAAPASPVARPEPFLRPAAVLPAPPAASSRSQASSSAAKQSRRAPAPAKRRASVQPDEFVAAPSAPPPRVTPPSVVEFSPEVGRAPPPPAPAPPATPSSGAPSSPASAEFGGP